MEKMKNWIKDLAKYILKDELNSLNSSIDFKDNLIDEKLNTISKLKYPNSKEEILNNAYKKINKTYSKKFLNENLKIDVRCFLGNDKNTKLPKFKSKDDELVITALKWVIKNFKYKTDKQTSGLIEYWSHSFETLSRKKNYIDCEDGGILLYDILRANGIPSWKLRLCAGDAISPFGGIDGHAYLVYYSEELGNWYAIDWCYYPNTKVLSTHKVFKSNKTYGDIWFCFNEDYVWRTCK